MLSFETEDSDLVNSLLYNIGCVIDTPYFFKDYFVIMK